MVPYVMGDPKSFVLQVHFLDYGVCLCHDSGGCSGGETVSGVSLLVLFNGIIARFGGGAGTGTGMV